MICINCGASLKENAKFCGKCGTKQPEVSSSPAETVPVTTVSASAEVSATPAANPFEAEALSSDAKKVDKLVYILLAVLLGAIVVQYMFFFAGLVFRALSP